MSLQLHLNTYPAVPPPLSDNQGSSSIPTDTPHPTVRFPAIAETNGDAYEDYKLNHQPDWKGATLIGRGEFGVVFTVGTFRGELCAVKRFSKTNPNCPRRLFEGEVANFAKLEKFFGWYDDEKYTYIVMEYVERADLEYHIKRKWSECDTKKIARQILHGLFIMHDDGIIHGDLKPAVSVRDSLNNIPFPSRHCLVPDSRGRHPYLVCPQSELNAKLGTRQMPLDQIDCFGASRQMTTNNGTIAETRSASPGYLAPEVLSPSSATTYTTAVDLWALGCILYRMVVGKTLFSKYEDIMEIGDGKKFTDFSQFQADLDIVDITDSGVEFMKGLIQPDPKQRTTAKNALKSNWIVSKSPRFQITQRQEGCLHARRQPIDLQPNEEGPPSWLDVTFSPHCPTTPAMDSRKSGTSELPLAPIPDVVDLSMTNTAPTVEDWPEYFEEYSQERPEPYSDIINSKFFKQLLKGHMNEKGVKMNNLTHNLDDLATKAEAMFNSLDKECPIE
ncbi:kinase-like protein, partial [Wilcoxina mikolae CBS 423.85]